jgi:predicted PurR-regulated permease PerM
MLIHFVTMTDPLAKSPNQSSRFQKYTFLLCLAAVTGAFLYMVQGFTMTVLMAAVFTGLTHPLYRFFLRKLKKPVVASSVTLLVLVLVGVMPVIAISIIAYQEASAFMSRFDPEQVRGLLAQFFRQLQDRYPSIMAKVNAQDIASLALNGLRNGLQYLLSQGANMSLSLANNVVSFFLMLFMMFYFYMDGENVLKRLIRWSPLRDDHEELMLQQFLTVSKATLKGILIIGLIQGFIGAILFLSVGLHAPVFLGTLMVFASVIPAVGGGLVWVPAALYLLLSGRIGAGVTVILVGVFVIGMVDNLLRPGLVGKDAKMHDLMVLVSTLGGLGLFGLPGFVIGPILASLVLTMWNLYEQVFKEELVLNAATESPGQSLTDRT